MALGTGAKAATDPSGVALTDGSRTLAWAEVDEALNRATNALIDADAGPDSRVAVYARNSTEVVIVHSAAVRAGVSSVPINAALTAGELAYILADSGAHTVFCGPETVDVAVEAAWAAGVVTVVAWRSAGAGGAEDWERWLSKGSPTEPPTDRAPRLHLMYTSGTTGRPKGTDLVFGNPGASVADYLARHAGQVPAAGAGPHLVVGPLHHTGPLIGLRYLSAGQTVVVLPRFDAEAVLAAIDRWRVSTTLMVPTHFTRLLALPEEVRRRYDVSSMRVVYHTGAACPIPVKRRMIEWFGPVLLEAYGASESGTVCQITSEEWLAHPGSVGRALPNFEALVLDDDGERAPAGTEGRLYFVDKTLRGIRYHNDPDASAAAHVAPGVFTIGEVGYVDEDGYVFITDRSTDMVVSGGVNIYPAEVEAALSLHPGVRDVACIGVPNADLGEEVKALVQPVDPAAPPSTDELVAFCRDRLAGYKVPKSVEIVDELGRTAMGKLDKRRLRAPYWPTGRTIGG